MKPVVIENCEKNNNVVGYEVLPVMVMKSSVFWDVTVYSPSQVKIQLFKNNISYQKSERIFSGKNNSEKNVEAIRTENGKLKLHSLLINIHVRVKTRIKLV